MGNYGKPVTKRFTPEGKRELQKWEKQKRQGNAPSLGRGRRSPQALRDAAAAAGGPSPLPKELIDRARRGDFAK